MITTEPTMTNLFLQLGLEEGPDAITRFIHTHHSAPESRWPMRRSGTMRNASSWRSRLKADAPWAMVVDQFNEALHADAVERRTEAEVPGNAEAVPSR